MARGTNEEENNLKSERASIENSKCDCKRRRVRKKKSDFASLFSSSAVLCSGWLFFVIYSSGLPRVRCSLFGTNENLVLLRYNYYTLRKGH